MEVLEIARWQFGITTVYHFFFSPLTMGLAVLTAILHTFYYRTGSDHYKLLTKYFGKLFIIIFALGVVTGIVLEFQFGMAWSNIRDLWATFLAFPLPLKHYWPFSLNLLLLQYGYLAGEGYPKGFISQHLAGCHRVKSFSPVDHHCQCLDAGAGGYVR
jgi:cytochrome bd ubiquinol oxidase subunit I